MISPYIPHSLVNYFTLHVCCTNKKLKVTLLSFLINIVIDLYITQYLYIVIVKKLCKFV